MSDILAQVSPGGVGLITLNRPQALNALTLSMIRELTAVLVDWQADQAVRAVAVRGQGKDKASPTGSSPFGVFCAGGDIRAFHEAALGGDTWLEDFFTEEYRLNHLIHGYAKPYSVCLDGIVMGGGMGISGHRRQGEGLRIVTERTRMAMPETNIGLFPDVGGGYFLSRCPGRIGEYLALTGQMIGGADAIAAGLADVMVDSSQLPALWDGLGQRGFVALQGLHQHPVMAPAGQLVANRAAIDAFFGLDSVSAIVTALERDGSGWATETASVLRKRSPLMLHVVLEQLRRARTMNLADDLRMERDMVYQCFHLRPGIASETVEGIRALVIDKDQAPRWNPARIEDVTPELVSTFFKSPWTAHTHPLRHLA